MAYFDKRWVGVFNYRFRRRFRHDLGKLEKAVEYILDTRPDVAVCTGDLTSAGQPGEFEKVRRVLEKLRDSDIPLIYMPGNHDCYVPRPKCVQAMKEMVAYLSCGRYTFEDFPCKICHKTEASRHKGQNIPGSVVTCQQQIKAGAASHGAKVQHLFFPVRFIPQVGSGQMLNGVDFSCVQHRLFIGTGQPQVKGGNGFCAHLVFSGHIQTGLQFDMINGKAGNLLHSFSPYAV